MAYPLDATMFIHAKNLHYGFDYYNTKAGGTESLEAMEVE